MSSPKKLPNSLRYFRARFRHLTTPSFVSSFSVASLLLLFVWELSLHPEWLALEENDNPPSNSNTLTENLSTEEASVMADIDNSSVLNGELETYKKLQLNPLVIPTDNLLNPQQGEAQNQSNSQKTTAKIEENFTNPQPETTASGEAKINNFFPPPNLTNLPQKLPDQNKTENSNLLTSPLLPSVKLLDPRNRAEENKEMVVSPLQTAMDEYLDSQDKSKKNWVWRPNPYNKNIRLGLYTENTTSYPIPDSLSPTQTQSEEQNNFNPPLPPINVTPQKPYYTDLSGSVNQSNNQTNLSGSNYLPQRESTTQTIPSLVPVVPNGLVNNQNIVNGVNNWGVPNYYNNQGFPQNQQQQYGYGVNPNQVNQGGQLTPSYNSFSRSNSFYNRSYGNSWNNPFNSGQNR